MPVTSYGASPNTKLLYTLVRFILELLLNARAALSTAEFAIKANVSVWTLSGVFNHGRPMTPRVAQRIATGLMNIPAVAGWRSLSRTSGQVLRTHWISAGGLTISLLTNSP